MKLIFWLKFMKYLSCIFITWSTPKTSQDNSSISWIYQNWKLNCNQKLLVKSITFWAYAIMGKLYTEKFYFFQQLASFSINKREKFHSYLQPSAKFINSGVFNLPHMMKFHSFVSALSDEIYNKRCSFLLYVHRSNFCVRHFPFTYHLQDDAISFENDINKWTAMIMRLIYKYDILLIW